jgi:hypothetical protein
MHPNIITASVLAVLSAVTRCSKVAEERAALLKE